MGENKNFIKLSIVFGIISAIYFLIYINVIGSNSNTLTSKIILTIILLVLIFIVITGIVLSNLKLKSQNNKLLNNDKKSENRVGKAAVSTLSGIGIWAIIIIVILIFFFMGISE